MTSADRVDRAYARRWRTAPLWRLEAYGLQARSIALRTVFAYAASDGTTDWSHLRLLVRRVRDGDGQAAEELAALRPRALRPLARMLANHRHTDDDAADALTILESLATHHAARLNDADRYLLLELAAGSGDAAAYRRALGTTRLGDTDLAHTAFLTANLYTAGTDVWNSTLNTAFAVAGLEPVEVAAGTGLPFDRLQAQPLTPPVRGPLVSVVMPTFEPDERIVTAVESLLRQSWQDLEVVVVDDGSTPRSRVLVDDLAQRDPRVRVVRHEARRGAYAARNTGLRAARGHYLTCHDDDDWSHPRKLERQVALLDADPASAASMSRHVRASDTLAFTRVNISPHLCQPNYSSIMVRRSEFLERFGGWDDSVKGADAELKARLERASGRDLPVVGGPPLSFTRHRTGSLSYGEMARGYVDPGRLAHRRSYERWHRSMTTQWALPASGERPFRLPVAFEATASAPASVFVGDFRVAGDETAGVLSVAARQLDDGAAVGLVHLESPWNLTHVDPVLVDGFWSLLDRGAGLLTVNDPVEAEVLVVADPATLHYAESMTSRLSARSTVLWRRAPEPVRGPARGPARYDPATVTSNAERLFGAVPQWRVRPVPGPP